MQVRLRPCADSAQAARVAVSDLLVRWGRADLVDDVTLIVTELVANVIMHARTDMSLAVHRARAGVRVTVTDTSHILPRWTDPSPTATAGRGLLLVARLSSRWGFEQLPGGGKCVWAEIDEASTYEDRRNPPELLELWPDEPWPAARATDAELEVEVVLEIDVQAMLDSRAHTEELVRDLQLALLRAADLDTPTDATAQVIGLAQRLDSVNDDFHEARRQIYNQTIRAEQQQHTQTTLRLRLHRSDAALARRWLEALNEADALTAAGTLLLAPFPAELTAFRREYIGAIVAQLDAAS